jgi:hypothetical protein
MLVANALISKIRLRPVGKTIMPPVSNSQLAKPGPGCCVDRRQKDFLVVENETAETNRLSNFHRFPELQKLLKTGNH